MTEDKKTIPAGTLKAGGKIKAEFKGRIEPKTVKFFVGGVEVPPDAVIKMRNVLNLDNLPEEESTE